MKNGYFINKNSNSVSIVLEHKDVYRITTIDLEDFEKVSKIPGSWYAMDVGGNRGEKIYAGTVIGGVTIYLHKFVLRSVPGLVIDHINHNSLDNRKGNLRNVSRAVNGQNRKGAQRNNKSSGYRNVYPTGNGNWYVQLNKDGITYRIGTYPSVTIANEVAIQAREFYYENGGEGPLEISEVYQHA